MSPLATLRTFDGSEWELRATTQTGTALYAVKGAPKCCPPYVMATLAELAEHGIQSTELAAAVTELGALPVPAGDAAAPLAVFRAQHDSIVMGLYTTAAEARKHCETELRHEWPDSLLDWIEDEEDGIAELVAESADGENPTGYVVTALEVAAVYDEGADE
ncbi:hypothetical protein [Streptomyces sp. NPDC096132]|uniref:hypothetical protein n=1 Tax=Streptomyces sp. NPDC096132 TaxID=3366075 RepID=UPI0037F6FBCF